MTEQYIRRILGLVLGGLYVGLLGYSVFGYSEGGAATTDEVQAQPRAPRVLQHDGGVEEYRSRSVRSNGQRGGGIRGGK